MIGSEFCHWKSTVNPVQLIGLLCIAFDEEQRDSIPYWDFCLCLSTALTTTGCFSLASASSWKQRSSRANFICFSAIAISQPMFPWKFFTHFDDAELSFKLVTNLESNSFPRAENFIRRISHRPADGMRNSPSGDRVGSAALIFEDTLTSGFPNSALCSQVKQCVCLILSSALFPLSRFNWAAFIDIYFFGAQAARKAICR